MESCLIFSTHHAACLPLGPQDSVASYNSKRPGQPLPRPQHSKHKASEWGPNLKGLCPFAWKVTPRILTFLRRGGMHQWKNALCACGWEAREPAGNSTHASASLCPQALL